MHRKSKIILLFVLIGIASFLAFYKLTESPPTWYDEGIYNQLAINTSLYGHQGIQVAPDTFVSSGFVTGGYPFFVPISWSLKLFGIGILQARFVMALFIMAMLLMAFALIYRMFGIRNSLLTLILLITFPVLYGNGKNVLGEVPGLLYLILFLFSVNEIEKNKYKGTSFYILAGLFGGLCLATKPIFFLLGGGVIIAVLIKRKSIDFNWKNLFIGFVVFLLPMIVWFKLQFMATDSATSILQYYANPYGLMNIKKVIFDNFLRFFHEASPMYFALIELIWLVSYIIRIVQKKTITLSETIAFMFSILVSIAYLRTAGWYRYYFVAEVVAIMFLVNNIGIVLDYFRLKFSLTDQKFRIFYALIITIFCLIQVYQLLFTSWVAVHYKNTISGDLKDFFVNVSNKTTFFIYNVPEVAIFLPNQKYYQYFEPTDSLNFGEEQISVLQSGLPDMVITTSRQLASISQNTKNYTHYKDIGGYVILKHKQ